MSQLRKCKVVRPYQETVDATFHQWGSKSVYGDGENSYPETVALVELEDGQMLKVDPECIKFA